MRFTSNPCHDYQLHDYYGKLFIAYNKISINWGDEVIYESDKTNLKKAINKVMKMGGNYKAQMRKLQELNKGDIVVMSNADKNACRFAVITDDKPDFCDLENTLFKRDVRWLEFDGYDEGWIPLDHIHPELAKKYFKVPTTLIRINNQYKSAAYKFVEKYGRCTH